MDRRKRGIIWLIFSIVILGYFFVGLKENFCVSKNETRTVRGGSMAGLIEEGKDIKILYGYYECNPVQRGDIVAYSYTADSNPIIKLVRGVPGDDYKLKMENEKWKIFVNNTELFNSNNQSYSLDDQEAKMLQLYEKDYQGKIPLDTYLILGNVVYGSLDSTKFGLVGKKDILGKVVY